MNMDKSVNLETTSAARQSIPDPVLHSMHAIAWQQYEFEQSLLSQQLWSQQQADSMEVSIKAVALKVAAQANGISHILKGGNDVSKEEVVKEIQFDSWKTSSWYSSASTLTSCSSLGLKNDQKEEETCPAVDFTSERNHKDDCMDYEDTHQESHGCKDRRNFSSGYRSHRPHCHERSRSRVRGGVGNRNRSTVRGGIRKRSHSRSRSRYLSRSPPKKYNEGRSRSRSRTRSRYRSRSPPKKHCRDEYYSHLLDDLKPKSTRYQQETRRSSSGGQIKSDNSHGNNCVQIHSATPWKCSSEQEKKDLLTKDNDAVSWPRWKE